MFTHVNLILSDGMPDKPQFLFDIATEVNLKLGISGYRTFVRSIYRGKLGSQHVAHLTVTCLAFGQGEAVRKLLTRVLNEFFVDQPGFLHYSFSNGQRVLESV